MTNPLDNPHASFSPTWIVTEVGNGHVRAQSGMFGLHVDKTTAQSYSNAQITDYSYENFEFRWRPPLRMTVRARASLPAHALLGTAGFGFWNHPFSPDVRVHRHLHLPQAIWYFFGSPPNDMQLARGVPGFGWKAAVIDAGRRRALALVPLALPALVLMRVSGMYDRIYPGIQRALGIEECLLEDRLLAETHTYALEWRKDHAVFRVDDRVVMRTRSSPRGPCGFVAWLDNQYAIVTPRGRFGAGLITLPQAQTLWLDDIQIEAL